MDLEGHPPAPDRAQRGPEAVAAAVNASYSRLAWASAGIEVVTEEKQEDGEPEDQSDG